MKRETIVVHMEHRAPRAFMLFCEDTPFRHRAERNRKKYVRKQKHRSKEEH